MSTKTKQGTRKWHHGEVEVCCHRVKFRYDIAYILKHGEELSDEAKSDLEQEAENRSKHCITEGYHSGDLCCLLQGDDLVGGEQEVFGWWEIARD
jgi:hypothetical protein